MELAGQVVVAVVVLIGAFALFAGAAWLGWRIIAPWLGRALDRADEDEQDLDRHD